MIAFFTWVPYNERHKLLSRLDGRDEYVEEYKMNCYEAEYRAKRVTVEEALDSLRDGDVIGTSQCANEPTAIFDAVDHLRGCGKHFRMFAPMCFQPHRFLSDPIYQDTFDMDITFLMGTTRKGRSRGSSATIPVTFTMAQAGGSRPMAAMYLLRQLPPWIATATL